jgi:hypothetical protein
VDEYNVEQKRRVHKIHPYTPNFISFEEKDSHISAARSPSKWKQGYHMSSAIVHFFLLFISFREIYKTPHKTFQSALQINISLIHIAAGASLILFLYDNINRSKIAESSQRARTRWK